MNDMSWELVFVWMSAGGLWGLLIYSVFDVTGPARQARLAGLVIAAVALAGVSWVVARLVGGVAP